MGFSRTNYGQKSSCQGQTAAHRKTIVYTNGAALPWLTCEEYKSTTIILNSADPSFSDTLSKLKAKIRNPYQGIKMECAQVRIPFYYIKKLNVATDFIPVHAGMI